MFLDNVAAFLLRQCQLRNLSYEAAAELCGISSRQFGNIVRKKCAPSIATIENICIAFSATPNDIFLGIYV